MIGVALVAVVEYYRPKLDKLFEHYADFLIAHSEVVGAVFFLFMTPVYVATIYLWRFGASIVAARRFPLPGVTKQIMQTPGIGLACGHRLHHVAEVFDVPCVVG